MLRKATHLFALYASFYMLERFWCRYLLDNSVTRGYSYGTNAHAWLYCITIQWPDIIVPLVLAENLRMGVIDY
jgi:hypothetical protein